MRLGFHLVFLSATIVSTFLTLCEGYYLDLLRINEEHQKNEGEVRAFLSDYNEDLQKLRTELVRAKWDFSVDKSDENKQKVDVLSHMVLANPKFI